MRTRVFHLRRQRSLPNAGAETLFFTCDGGSRKSPHPIFRAAQVPEFDGDTAWFEAERVPRIGWRIVRRVDERGRPYEETALRERHACPDSE
jgi:hypothetical protein